MADEGTVNKSSAIAAPPRRSGGFAMCSTENVQPPVRHYAERTTDASLPLIEGVRLEVMCCPFTSICTVTAAGYTAGSALRSRFGF